MQAYMTKAIAKFGPGDVLGLSDAQIMPRRHSVEIISKQQGGAVVRATGPVEFMAGEVIGIEKVPPRLAAAVELADAEPKGRRTKAADAA